MFTDAKKCEGRMRLPAALGSSLFFAISSTALLPAAAADMDGSPKAHSSEHATNAHQHKGLAARKTTGAVRQTMPEAPNEAKNLAWTTHALPKGNWIFTRYGINGTYPDNYP